jgi:uncharacterized protein YabE (DUF348 family)
MVKDLSEDNDRDKVRKKGSDGKQPRGLDVISQLIVEEGREFSQEHISNPSKNPIREKETEGGRVGEHRDPRDLTDIKLLPSLLLD